MPDDLPKLRPIDIVPIQTRGRQAYLLRDPEGLSPHEVVVPADVAYLISQFDGTHTVREAQVSYVRRFGTLLTTDKIADVLRRLDEAVLLDTERFREFRAKVEADFRARATRAAAHAGQSYEEGAGAFVTAWEPRLAAASPPDDFPLDDRRPALIVPHYDMNAAADSYAAAYALLGRGQRPQVAVILGIGHGAAEAPFVLTRKPFETPFGALETDRDLIDKLEQEAPFDLFAEEALHRNEHSVEFQAVLLHFLCREGEPPAIVPILCGGYHRADGGFADPAQPGAVAEFLELLRGTLSADSRRIAVIASADLSHIGARFGQPPPLTQAHLQLARRHDTALLERAQAGDAEGLYQALSAEQDRFNVCGFPAMYALLRALPITEGRLLNYRRAADPQTQSCVSFASVALR